MRVITIAGAIILVAALTSGLYPFLRSAREEAARNACMENLRQIAAATKAYAEDNDGCFPSGTNGHHYWMFMLGRYLGGQMPATFQAPIPHNVFVCPSNPCLHRLSHPEKLTADGRAAKWGLIADPEGGYEFYCSYAINEHIADEWPRVSEWQAPSRSFFFLEANDGDIESNELARKLAPAPDYRLPHNGGLDIAYVDGHVEYHKAIYRGDLRNPDQVKWIFPPDYGGSGFYDKGEWTAPSND